MEVHVVQVAFEIRSIGLVGNRRVVTYRFCAWLLSARFFRRLLVYGIVSCYRVLRFRVKAISCPGEEEARVMGYIYLNGPQYNDHANYFQYPAYVYIRLRRTAGFAVSGEFSGDSVRRRKALYNADPIRYRRGTLVVGTVVRSRYVN